MRQVELRFTPELRRLPSNPPMVSKQAHPHDSSSCGTTLTGHHLTLADVQANIILGEDIHLYVRRIYVLSRLTKLRFASAPVEVVALENTLNGTIIPQEEIIAISDYVHSEGLKMHLDGARLWHVAIETGKPMNELCAPFDSVSLCFSKGLGQDVLTYLRKFAHASFVFQVPPSVRVS